MSLIGLLFATTNEVPGIIHAPPAVSASFKSYKLGNVDLVVAVSGIGQGNAASTTLRLCSEFRLEYILVSGICGGSRADVDIGDLLIADSVHYNGAELPLNSAQLENAKLFCHA